MGFAFRAMIWIITFNLAVGVVVFAFGQNNWLKGTTIDPTKGLNQTSDLYGQAGVTAGVPVEETSFWYRFLDVISLGFYNKIMVFLDGTIFSIPNLLVKIIPAVKGLIGYINGLIMLVVVMGMFEIFTGKDLTLR